MDTLLEQIKHEIETTPIKLFMKGTKEMPMCGYSNTVVRVLDHYGVSFSATNVLEDPSIRVKLTEYSKWPTIPQLFVKGELIGGCDIVVELHQKNELSDILNTTK